MRILGPTTRPTWACFRMGLRESLSIRLWFPAAFVADGVCFLGRPIPARLSPDGVPTFHAGRDAR
ncbi:MAG: hypothetical protein AAF471_00770 [Myxococcota bacterium]